MEGQKLSTHLELNDGNHLPVLGFGVYQTRGEVTKNSVASALKWGYSHIDTAAVYDNEAEVGQAIRESGMQRNTIWITTKLWTEDYASDAAFRACLRSLSMLNVGPYLDLYLLHSPRGEGRGEGKTIEAWKALERMKRDGRVRSIGVSNFSQADLEQLLPHCEIRPAVNQIEVSPFHTNRPLVSFCQSAGIAVMAYSPLTQGKNLKDPRLLSIAKKYNKTPAQICIRWCLQRGVVPIPRSTCEAHIQENARVFDFALTSTDMHVLDQLDTMYATPASLFLFHTLAK